VIWSSEKVLKVPQSALFRQGTSWSVFAIAGGRSKRRDVEIGHRTQAEAEILSGIGVGEEVILHPSNQLNDGARVREQ
jgi:HlyD family secretion protein